MLTKPMRSSNLAPLDSDDAKYVRDHVFAAIQLIPRHRHNKGKDPNDCDNCIILNHLVTALLRFKRIGE